VRVVVTGAAGQTGRLVVQQLVDAGHDVAGLVRRADQAQRLEHVGASARLGDLTELAPTEMAQLLRDVDAVVWAAGSGYGSDPAHLDGDSCIAAQQAADEVGIARWVQISSMFADAPEHGPAFLQAVLAAKHRSDTAVQSSGLGWTVIRPGGLTNDSATGRVQVGTGLRGGFVPRADVAAVVVACLNQPSTARRAFDLVAGEQPVGAALAGLAFD
jgi:uncharacterized protein YbjT (DUF2867 family)